MLHLQVHAISNKAADVRSVVMALNAKRQEADEAGDHSMPPEAGYGEQAQQGDQHAIAWQDYDEVRDALALHAPCMTAMVCSSVSGLHPQAMPPSAALTCAKVQADEGQDQGNAIYSGQYSEEAYTTEVPDRLPKGRKGGSVSNATGASSQLCRKRQDLQSSVLNASQLL